MKLTINAVSKTYDKKKVIDNLSIELHDGVTGLLGPNGAGKSTLMKMIATIEKPSSGHILFNDVDISKKPKEIRNVLGYLPQNFGIYPNMNPVEFLEYMAAMKNLSVKSSKKRIDELLEILHLSDFKKQMVGGFSGGMRQRVGIAQALLNDPDVLIVDEPTVGLDPEERIQFRNLLSSVSANKIVLLSTHIVTDIESIAPNIAIMLKGKLVANKTPDRLLQSVDAKVWNSIIPIDKMQELQQKFQISSSMQKSDGIHARIISESMPSLDAKLLQPSLEDAYLWLTNKEGDNQC